MLAKIDNINIYYERYNTETEETIVLLHGFLSSSFCYRKLIPLLQKKYHIVAIDLPPFGKSDKTTSFSYSYQNLATIVLKLLKQLQIDHPVLVGHSMGGQIALFAAKQAPQQIKKLILLGSSGYLPRLKKPLALLTYLPFSTIYLRSRLQKQGVHHNLKVCVSDPSVIDEEMIRGYETPFDDLLIFPSIKKLARDREGDLQADELKQIKTPTLLIWGAQDKVVPLEKGQQLHNDLAHSTLTVYKDAGHLIPEEKPEQVTRDIIQFMSTEREHL